MIFFKGLFYKYCIGYINKVYLRKFFNEIITPTAIMAEIFGGNDFTSLSYTLEFNTTTFAACNIPLVYYVSSTVRAIFSF